MFRRFRAFGVSALSSRRERWTACRRLEVYATKGASFVARDQPNSPSSAPSPSPRELSASRRSARR
jgi:hypothetical protein